MKSVVIVGGGITGLAAAYRLRKISPHLHLELWEASPRFGGILETTTREGFLLESGPDCFVSEKPRGTQLCDELGLFDDILATESAHRRSFIVKGKDLIPTPEGFYLMAPSLLRPFLSTPLLSWRAKWRALAEACLPAHPQPSDESLASFVRRRFGAAMLDSLAQPLIAGIYAADPETLSLQATFPQFLEMERRHGSVLVGLKHRDKATRSASGARYSLFVTLRRGMQSLADTLLTQLQDVARPGVAVQRMRRSQDRQGWELVRRDGETLHCDAVCLALPAYRSAEVLESEHALLSDLLNRIPYSGSATIQFAYREGDIRHRLDGFGFVVPHREHRTTLACTFVHRKFPGRVPKGHALLRAFVGGAMQSDSLQLDDRELTLRVQKDLESLLGIDRPPIFTQLRRWPRAMPQYTLGHVSRILQIEETVLGLNGLALAGNWLRGVGIPDCIESGERAAERLANFLN